MELPARAHSFSAAASAGASLQFLAELVPGLAPAACSAEFIQQTIRPSTSQDACAYLDLVHDLPGSVGQPTYSLSYPRQLSFRQCIQVLLDHFLEAPANLQELARPVRRANTYLWLDAFSLNHHQLSNQPHLLVKCITAAVKQAPKTLLLVDRQGAVLSDAQVLFEVSLALLEHGAEGVEVVCPRFDPAALEASLNALDASHAKASSPELKAALLEAIEGLSPGQQLASLGKQLRGGLLEAVLAQARQANKPTAPCVEICVLASFLLRTCNTSASTGRTEEALPFAQRALSLVAAVQTYSSDKLTKQRDELRAAALSEAGSLMCALGQPADGEGHLRAAAELSKALHGADSAEAAAATLALAECLQAQVRAATQAACAPRGSAAPTATPASPATAATAAGASAATAAALRALGHSSSMGGSSRDLSNRGGNGTDRGTAGQLMFVTSNADAVMGAKRDEALSLFEAAAGACEARYGMEHESTAAVYGSWALALQEAGQLERAEALLRRALAADEQVLGVAHEATALSASNLATLLVRQDRPGEAQEMQQRAMAVWEPAFGLNHPHVASGHLAMSEMLRLQGRLPEAEAAARRALESSEQVFGTLSGQVSNVLLVLGGLQREQGFLRDAESSLRRALTVSLRANGDVHESTGACLASLASLLNQKGGAPEAEHLLRQCGSVYNALYGLTHPLTLSALVTLADSLARRGHNAEAVQRYEEAVQASIGVNGDDDAGTEQLRAKLKEVESKLAQAAAAASAAAAVRHAGSIDAGSSACGPAGSTSAASEADSSGRASLPGCADAQLEEASGVKPAGGKVALEPIGTVAGQSQLQQQGQGRLGSSLQPLTKAAAALTADQARDASNAEAVAVAKAVKTSSETSSSGGTAAAAPNHLVPVKAASAGCGCFGGGKKSAAKGNKVAPMPAESQ